MTINKVQRDCSLARELNSQNYDAGNNYIITYVLTCLACNNVSIKISLETQHQSQSCCERLTLLISGSATERFT